MHCLPGDPAFYNRRIPAVWLSAKGAGGGGDSGAQEMFLRARLGYKRFEWAAEYFEPTASRIVNGPPVPEVELSGQVFEPSGLQVIAGWLFPRYDPSRKMELLKQLQRIAAACGKYKTRWANIDIAF